MNKISSLDTIFVSLIKVAKKGENAQIELFDFFKKMTCGYGTDLSRIEYKGESFKSLVSTFGFDKLANAKMRKPQITINGRSRVKGQGIFGIKLTDGNKTLGNSAIGIDLTQGEPILQMQMSVGNGAEKAFGFKGIINTNFKTEEALHYNFFLNEEVALQMGMPKDTIRDIAKIKEMAPKKLTGDNEALINEVRALFKNKGFTPSSIDRCIPTLVEIASKEGEVTEKSAKSALNLLLKHMGYNPKNVKLKFVGGNNLGGQFDIQTGNLYLNIEMLKDWQDYAVTMGHEVTHMEDWIILYKALGPEKFKKLHSFDKFNQAWYDKMSHFVSTKHLAFEHKGKVTAIVCEDGSRITDPQKIKEYLDCYEDTPRFNLSVMEKELRKKARVAKANLSGDYSRMTYMKDYVTSDIEGHARETEVNLASALKKSGVLHSTKLSSEYGKNPGKRPIEYSTAFTRIDKALSKYGKNKCAKFNELYEEIFREIDPELAELKAKIASHNSQGIFTQETEMLRTKYDNLVLLRHLGQENLEIAIMEGMQQRLGLPVKSSNFPRYIPLQSTKEGSTKFVDEVQVQKVQNAIESQVREIQRELYLQALTKIDPEIGEIQKALFEGRPKAEFQKLVKEKAELIKTRYGNASMLEAKIHKEMKAIEVSNFT